MYVCTYVYTLELGLEIELRLGLGSERRGKGGALELSATIIMPQIVVIS